MSKYLTVPKNFVVSNYQRFTKMGELIYEIIAKNSSQNLTILDIGCGDGQFLKYLKDTINTDKNIKWIGLEKFVKDTVFPFTFLSQDAEDPINLPDNSVDIVIAGEIIEHVRNTDGLIKEIYRLLKDDGFALVTTPNLASYFNRFLLLLGYQPYHSEVSEEESGFGQGLVYKVLGRPKYGNKTAGHLRLFTYKSFKDFAKSYGFKISGYYPAYFSHFREDNKRIWLIKLFFFFDRLVSVLFPTLASGMIFSLKKADVVRKN